METKKIYRYLLEGHTNINDFAKGILFLTNQRSSVEGTVIDFRTYDESNLVAMYAYDLGVGFDLVLKQYFQSIEEKEEADLLIIGGYEDYKAPLLEKLEQLEYGSDKDFHILEVSKDSF